MSSSYEARVAFCRVPAYNHNDKIHATGGTATDNTVSYAVDKALIDLSWHGAPLLWHPFSFV